MSAGCGQMRGAGATTATGSGRSAIGNARAARQRAGANKAEVDRGIGLQRVLCGSLLPHRGLEPSSASTSLDHALLDHPAQKGAVGVVSESACDEHLVLACALAVGLRVAHTSLLHVRAWWRSCVLVLARAAPPAARAEAARAGAARALLAREIL
ncbi:hypothetical protein T492DRAFT_1127189 [Pavlovales sp. CCMP2436]|nr:hypothetical protein T492DRAFT_1127189 [Pavlovales sp. CCMP2436]